MYPSGQWRAYWEQAGWGRQLMHNFVLRFADGVVEGEGRDCIGPFTFRGQYDDRGSIRMIKQYIGMHRVLYEGTYDGEGTVFGRWSIGALWSGPFAMSPAAAQADPDAPIQSL
jgi:hypothetical protein